MSEQGTNTDHHNWWEQLPFTKVFEGFRSAMQPGKLLLALAGILAIFLSGWILDGLTPAGSLVVIEAGGNGAQTDLAAYAQGARSRRSDEFEAFRNRVRRENEERLTRLTQEALRLNESEAQEFIAADDTLEQLQDRYDDTFDKAIDRLETRYDRFVSMTKKRHAKRLDNAASSEEKTLRRKERDNQLDEAKQAYLNLFDSLAGKGQVRASYSQQWINQLVQVDSQATGDDKTEDEAAADRDKKQLSQALILAEACQLAQATEGQGIFRTLVDFNGARFHGAVNALVFERDLGKVGDEIWQLLMSVCWLARFHCIFAVIFGAIWLAVWSIVGGAICRITALQSARDERIGPMRALHFALARFWGFFSAPLVPLGIAAAICLVIVICSLLGAIPVIGEILVGALLGLSLVGGFVVTLVVVGLIGGMSLMYPTIAVEGSDGFDAISRSFSYVFARPWRMALYTFLAAVYGAICYLFVRFFAFILLLAVRSTIAAGANLGDASLIDMRGKLDGIWPIPTFIDLQPTINWMALNWSESLGAFMIMIWVAIVVGLVIAFVVSFFFSVNTKIYFLLRHRVDATDMEDVYIKEDIDDIAADADVAPPAVDEPTPTPTEETPTEPSPTPPPADTDTPEPDKTQSEQ